MTFNIGCIPNFQKYPQMGSGRKENMHLVNFILNNLPNSWQNWLRRFWLDKKGYNIPFFDLWLIDKKKPDTPKRAILSYIITPFIISSEDKRNLMFSNFGIAKSIVEILNGLGFIVDIVEYTDEKFIPKRKYQLFIGHGGLGSMQKSETSWL